MTEAETRQAQAVWGSGATDSRVWLLGPSAWEPLGAAQSEEMVPRPVSLPAISSSGVPIPQRWNHLLE